MVRDPVVDHIEVVTAFSVQFHNFAALDLDSGHRVIGAVHCDQTNLHPLFNEAVFVDRTLFQHLETFLSLGHFILPLYVWFAQ